MPPWLGNELQVTAEKQEQPAAVPALDARLLAGRLPMCAAARWWQILGATTANLPCTWRAQAPRAAWWRRIYAPHRWRVRARLWKSTGAGRQ